MQSTLCNLSDNGDSCQVQTRGLRVSQAILLHRFTRILDLALSGLDDQTIDLAGAHGDAGEADFVQAADRVDIATVLAADEDFELRIDGAGVFDERADHLLDGGMDGDERMTLEEFLVDVERQEAVGVVAVKRDEFGGGIQNGLDSASRGFRGW